MRNILGFGAVLTVSCLVGSAAMAQVPAGAGNQAGAGAAGVSGRVNTSSPSSLITAPNNLEQQANENAANQAAAANAAVPGQVVPGQVAATPAQPGVVTTPANPVQTPGAAVGTPTNPAGVAPGTVNPGTVNAATAGPLPPGTPGEWNYRATNPAGTYAPGVQQGYQGTATAATPGYAGRVMPGMTGYNAVNPMGTTMAPSYYYAGTAGMPYATYSTPGYSSYGQTGYYTAQGQPYVVQRRGLFGRRNRIVYPASPYGATTYSSYPSGYANYGTTTYSTTPGTYSYGTTTYSTTPGTYTYGPYPR